MGMSTLQVLTFSWQLQGEEKEAEPSSKPSLPSAALPFFPLSGELV
jgi:hypothetical protein